MTVDRLARGLAERGVPVTVLDLSRLSADAWAGALDAFRPDVVHAFHAFRAAARIRRAAAARGLPLVVSLTGTDANIDLLDPARRAATAGAIRAAAAVVAFHEGLRARVAATVPEAASRIVVIAPGVRLESGPEPTGGVLGPRAPGEVRLLLVAGIRAVKNVPLSVEATDGLAARHRVRLLLAGPIIEPAEGARLRAALAGREWATYLGEVPHARMAALLDECDVALNASRSEGMANALLEAMARGRAVLASDIEGNRALIEHEVDGLLFAGAAGFRREAERLVGDRALRARLGAAARAKVERLYAPERELDAHLALYARVLAGAGRRPR